MSAKEYPAVDVMAIDVARLTAAGLSMEEALETAAVSQGSTEGKAASEAYAQTSDRLAAAAEAAVRDR